MLCGIVAVVCREHMANITMPNRSMVMLPLAAMYYLHYYNVPITPYPLPLALRIPLLPAS